MMATAALPIAAGTGAVMTVSADVLPGCSIEAGAMAFGAIDANAAAAGAGGTTQTAVALDCTAGTAFAITMDEGLHGARRMANAAGTGFLDYEIYRDAAGTQPWGSTGAGAVGGIAPPEGKVTLNAYGRVLDGAARPGRYEDVITVHVTF